MPHLIALIRRALRRRAVLRRLRRYIALDQPPIERLAAGHLPPVGQAVERDTHAAHARQR